HTQVPAVFAKNSGIEIRKRLRIEFPEIPVACLAHGFFAAQIVQIKNQPGFVLLRHSVNPPCVCGLGRSFTSWRRPPRQFSTLTFACLGKMKRSISLWYCWSKLSPGDIPCELTDKLAQC